MKTTPTTVQVELSNGSHKILADQGYLTKEDIKRTTVQMKITAIGGFPSINEEIATFLQLCFIEKRTFKFYSGELVQLDIAGPVEIHLGNTWDTCYVIVLKGNSQPNISSTRINYLTKPYVRI